MNSARKRSFLALAGLACGVAGAPIGCRAPQPEVPFGQWSGQGTVAYVSWDTSDASDKKSGGTTIVRRYPTHLRIRPGKLEGREVIEMEILSERGPLPDLEERTHLQMALFESKRPSSQVTLYRLAGWQFNPDFDDPLKWDKHGTPLSASAIADDRGVTVLIQYMENYVDTLRFEGGAVHKFGVLSSEEGGIVHWSEVLGKTDAGDGPWERVHSASPTSK